MTLKVGVISPKNLIRPLSSSEAPKDASVMWFSEIEACFAYLLFDRLDQIFIDNSLMDGSHACTIKYQKLINQLQPNLKIVMRDCDERSPLVQPANTMRYFPRLETLFKNGELKTVFQPIMQVKGESRSIHGIECLSRLHFNGQTFAPEFVFNYAAEKLKLTNYDRICLMQALRLSPHDRSLLVFINVRPQTLAGEDFCPWLKELLKKYQISPEQVIIEVTEQYCVVPEKEMMNSFKSLTNAGIRLAVDDFGSGISNHSMLEIMQPHYIKISGRFTKNSHLDQGRQKIIKNIFLLAHDFGVNAIVENVELAEEWQQVRALGAQLAQGFYFYRPMPKEEIEDLLGSKR